MNNNRFTLLAIMLAFTLLLAGCMESKSKFRNKLTWERK